jgi:ankyrin repeat protein
MRKWMRYALQLAAALGVLTAHAGSYEDFFVAIKQDDPGAVRTLLQRGFDPNTPNPQGHRGLFLALQEPAPRVAEVLVDWPQTQIEARTAQDESPLMIAALKGQTALVRKLVDRGADVNKPGWAPLHYAATGGHLEIMNLLLEHHAFIDAESPNGTTPLMMAAHYGTPAAVKLLLEAGADTAMRNQLGLTAIDFAQRANRADSAELIASHVRKARANGKW